MNPQRNEKGFTIIEVVLVLAIAGLIFLMVFIALPALQRSQRDNSRKNDASTVAASINTYRSNNRTLSGLSSATLQKYIDKLDQYENTDVGVVTGSNNKLSPTLSQVRVKAGRKCPEAAPVPGAANVQTKAGTARQAVVVILLENNGRQSQYHCIDV